MSVDTLRNNPEELIIKLDNLGDFAEPLNTLFKSRNLGNLKNFLSKNEFNSFHQRVILPEIEDLIRKSEYLKKLSLKANRTDDETQELLSQENAKFLPDGLRNKLLDGQKQKVVDKANSLNINLIDKSKINSLKQGEHYETILSYIKFLENLDSKEKNKLEKFLKSGDIKKDGMNLKGDTINGLAGYITLFNSIELKGIIPQNTLEKLNNLVYEYIKSGLLSNDSVILYMTTEAGILGLAKRQYNLDIGNSATEVRNLGQNHVDELLAKYSNIPGMKEVTDFFEKNGPKIEGFLTKKGISDNEIDEYNRILKEFDTIIINTKKKSGFIPWVYLDTKNRLEAIKNDIGAKNPEQEKVQEHTKKMLALLNSVLAYSKVEYRGKDSKIQAINDLIKKVDKGEIKKFDNISYFGDNGIQGILGDYFRDIFWKLDDKKGSLGYQLKEKLKSNGIDSWFWKDRHLMNMDKLDRLVDLLDFDGLENSFDVINATVAVRMIDDKNTNNKGLALNLMIPSLEDELSRKGKKLEPNPKIVEDHKKTIESSFGDGGEFIPVLNTIPRAQQEQIVIEKSDGKLSPEDVKNLSDNALRKEVWKLLKDKAIEDTATQTAKVETIEGLYKREKSLFTGVNKTFLETYNSTWIEIKQRAKILIEEALIFAAVEVVTGGIGGFFVSGTRLGIRTTSYLGRVAEAGADATRLQRFGAGTIRTTQFVGRRAFEAGMYTGINGLVRGSDQITLENFMTMFGMMFGGAIGIRLANGTKILKTDKRFVEFAKQTLAGSAGATTGIIGAQILFGDGTSIKIEDAPDMILQGVIMGSLMFPMMKYAGGAGSWLGGKAANSRGRQDRLVRQADANNKTTDMIASQKKLDLEARTKAYNEAIATNEGNFTARIVNRAKLVPEGVKLTAESAYIEGWLGGQQRLNKTIIKRAGSQRIGDSDLFYSKGNEILKANGDTLVKLPDGTSFTSVRYYKIGNENLPILTLSNGSTIRIYGNGKLDIPESILQKAVNGDVEISYITKKIGGNTHTLYEVVTRGQSEPTYYTKKGIDATQDIKSRNIDLKNPDTRQGVLASGKITIEELSFTKVGENKKRQWDKAVDQIMNEQILKDFGLFKEKLQKVANDTNIPPKVRNIAKSWLGKIVKAPISATKALFTKGLMGLGIIAAGTGTLAYTNDWDLHWDTLAVALAAYILVDDVGQIRTSLVNKIPYGGEIANVIGKGKNMLPDWAQNLGGLGIILGTGYLYETTARPKIVK